MVIMDNKIVSTSKIFESKIRLQMIASLSVGDLTFNQLKEVCCCTNGNMTTHTTKLLEAGFITKEKTFVHDKPQTTYHLTTYGKEEFNKYVKLLYSFIE